MTSSFYRVEGNVLPRTGTWTLWNSASHYGGSIYYSKTANSYVEMPVWGDRIKLGVYRSNNYGKGKIYLNTVDKGVVDFYTPYGASYQRILWDSGKLNFGKHTFKLNCLNEKNDLSSDTYIDIDFLDVYSDLVENTALTYDANWTVSYNANHSDGSYHLCTASSGVASLLFYGTGVDYYAYKSSLYGIMEIFIDDVSKGTADLYSSSAQFQQLVKSIRNLPLGFHTVRIQKTGTKNTSSSNYYANIDFLRLYNDKKSIKIPDERFYPIEKRIYPSVF